MLWVENPESNISKTQLTTALEKCSREMDMCSHRNWATKGLCAQGLSHWVSPVIGGDRTVNEDISPLVSSY